MTNSFEFDANPFEGHGERTDFDGDATESYDSEFMNDSDGVCADTDDSRDIDDKLPEANPDSEIRQPNMQVREERPVLSDGEIVAGVKGLGRGLADEAVVLSRGAVRTTLGEDARQPHDLDLAVSPEAYAYLRNQEGWDESGGRLNNGVYDVGVEWGDASHEDLLERSWTTESGIKVASLSDVVSWKTWGRGETKDLADIEAIRSRLLDPEKPPLPNRVVSHEMEVARKCLPENLRDDPNAQVAIELAGSGLATVRALYGDDRIGRPNQIVGDLERPEYKVTALYHNGIGLPEDMRALQRHMGNVGATDDQRLDALVADVYSDIVYGNGRRSDNPEGYDELRSANLAEAHALGRGYDPARAALLREAVLGTGFNEQTGRQEGRHHPDIVVRAVTGVDLQGLSEPECIQGSLDIAVEDGMSARYSHSRTIGQVAIEQGVRISTTEEGLRFIDENPDLRPMRAPEGPTVLEAFAKRLLGNADFVDPAKGYTPPDGWTLENVANRRQSAAKLKEIGERLLNRDMTAQEAASEAEAHRIRLARE